MKYYFCSFGLSPLTELDSYLHGDVFCPTEQIQPRQEVFWTSLFTRCKAVPKRKEASRNNEQFLVTTIKDACR